MTNMEVSDSLSLGIDVQEIIKDYKLAYTSRQVSLIGRRRGDERKSQIWNFWRRQRTGSNRHGKSIQRWGFSFWLLPGSDAHVCNWYCILPGIFCAAVRTRRGRSRSMVSRTANE